MIKKLKNLIPNKYKANINNSQFSYNNGRTHSYLPSQPISIKGIHNNASYNTLNNGAYNSYNNGAYNSYNNGSNYQYIGRYNKGLISNSSKLSPVISYMSSLL